MIAHCKFVDVSIKLSAQQILHFFIMHTFGCIHGNSRNVAVVFIPLMIEYRTKVESQLIVMTFFYIIKCLFT